MCLLIAEVSNCARLRTICLVTLVGFVPRKRRGGILAWNV